MADDELAESTNTPLDITAPTTQGEGSAENPYPPSEKDLLALLSSIHAAQPDLGLQKRLELIKQMKPEWAVSLKRIRTLQSQHSLRPAGDSIPAPASSAEEAEAWEPVAPEFAKMWREQLGPPASHPRAPPHVYNSLGYESGLFPALFPGGTGHYTPDMGTVDLYTAFRLGDERFQRSRDWLQWSLTRVRHEGTAALINYFLIVNHSMKARHLGDCDVQSLSPEQKWDDVLLEDGKLIPLVPRDASRKSKPKASTTEEAAPEAKTDGDSQPSKAQS